MFYFQVYLFNKRKKEVEKKMNGGKGRGWWGNKLWSNSLLFGILLRVIYRKYFFDYCFIHSLSLFSLLSVPFVFILSIGSFIISLFIYKYWFSSIINICCNICCIFWNPFRCCSSSLLLMSVLANYFASLFCRVSVCAGYTYLLIRF